MRETHDESSVSARQSSGAWFTTVLAVTVLLLCNGVFAQEEKRSVFWEPYKPDGLTATLCHFDGHQVVAVEELLDEDLQPGLTIRVTDHRFGGVETRLADKAIPQRGDLVQSLPHVRRRHRRQHVRPVIRRERLHRRLVGLGGEQGEEGPHGCQREEREQGRGEERNRE